MDKIYRRPTQGSDTPQKKIKKKNRVRDTIVNFRASEKEKELIFARCAMTGLSKLEFFIQSCMYQAILVKGNIKTFSEIKMKLAEISAALDKNPRLESLEPVQVESFKTILQILNVMF